MTIEVTMSEHELWNELGNLYFMTGTYSQAAYAYNRSIQMDSGFGRPYCNLALTYVKQGRYAEAVQLYQRSIDLLVDEKERAITWYRLGDVYRHLKDYRDAIMAYQQADLLDPQLSQERKESDQILYGGSGAQAENTAPAKQEVFTPREGTIQVAAPAPAQEQEEPVVVAQEIQAAPDLAEPQIEETDPVMQEPQMPDPTLEPLAEEVMSLPQDEEHQIATPIYESPVDERVVVAERAEAQIPSDLPAGETTAITQDELYEAAAPVPEPLEEPVTLSQVDELVQALPVEETAAISREMQPEASFVVPEAVVDEVVVISPNPENLVEADVRTKLVDETPVAAQEAEIQAAPLSEPKPTPLTEDPASESTAMADADSIQEGLMPLQETVSDAADAGGGEDEYPYPDFEHETEVFIPKPEEGPLDDWLPITQAETFTAAPAAHMDSVFVQDPEPVINEAAQYPEGTRPEYRPLPVSQPRYAAEMSPAAEQQVDVDVQDDYAQAVFIIPEEQEEQACDARSEPEEVPSIEGSGAEEEDEELKEIEREIVRFKQVVQANPRSASGWDTLGTLYKSARKYRDAILAYQQAVVADPSKAPYHHHLGIIYAVEGRDEDAIKAFQDVLEIDPNHSLAHASLGGYYRRMGLEELAQKHIGRAMKNFYNSENEYNRACLEALCGNTEQSIELLRVALKNKQTYVDWVLRDPDLDSIRRDPRFKQLISDYTA